MYVQAEGTAAVPSIDPAAFYCLATTCEKHWILRMAASSKRSPPPPLPRMMQLQKPQVRRHRSQRPRPPARAPCSFWRKAGCAAELLVQHGRLNLLMSRMAAPSSFLLVAPSSLSCSYLPPPSCDLTLSCHPTASALLTGSPSLGNQTVTFVPHSRQANHDAGGAGGRGSRGLTGLLCTAVQLNKLSRATAQRSAAQRERY